MKAIFNSLVLLSTCVLIACGEPDASRSGRTGIEDAVATNAALNSPQVIFQIGTIDARNGRAGEVFGKIRDLAVDASGNIFILDQQDLTIQWFDSTGKYRGGAGRAGPGPGEFRAPMGIELDGRGRIRVLDAAYRRISIFARSDSGLVLENTTKMPLHAIDFCIIDSLYYLLAPRIEGIIHEVDFSGILLHSFGSMIAHVPTDLKQHSAIIRKIQNRGRLACITSPPVIVMLHEQLPIVRAFNKDGSLRWTTSLKNYHPVQWEVSSNGRGLRMAIDPALGSVHTGIFITPTENARLAVTLIEVDPIEREKTLEVRILSLLDGHQLSENKSHFVPTAVQDSIVVGFKNTPFPRILGIGKSNHGIKWE